jgi:putative ABC transport system permease protein|tara:strand:- start:1553 stop:2791 length:1239 start_codon:yes stop_codon:yes gene_type:complete
MFSKLALQSLLDRKGSVALAVLAMSVSIFIFLGVEHIRHQAKESFSRSVSGVDLIVGARTSRINLLMYSVFRIGSPTNNIHWDTYQSIADNSHVKWTIPISLGDSHKGYRVLGTSEDYFEYFSYGRQQPLVFSSGRKFENIFDVVLGSEVAEKLGYQIGDELILAHGIAATSFSLHKNRPFSVVGIMAATGTPVDQTLHVSLQAIEAIHSNWQQDTKTSGSDTLKAAREDITLQPKSITAIMLGLKSKVTTFRIHRAINNYADEPLMAILPGVALSELWQMMSLLENILLLVSTLVFIAACLGVCAMLLSSIRERNGEIQLLRVIGAPPYFLFFLIQLEALLITVLSCIIGGVFLALCLLLFRDYLVSNYGLYIEIKLLSQSSFYVFLTLISASLLIAVIPSMGGYRQAKVN